MIGQLSLWDQPAGYGTPAIPLKPRQVAAHEAVKRNLAAGMDKQLVALPTGVGKTIFAVHVSADYRQTLFLVHREELLDQTVAAYKAVWPGLAVGIWRGRQEPAGEPVVVSTIQTAHARLGRLRRDAFDLLILDECFTAGTLVDDRPIETLQLGDLVTAYDEATGQLCRRRVTHLFKRPAPQWLAELHVGDRRVVCTLNHPVYTRRGWFPAGLVREGDEVLVTGEVEHVVSGAVPALREDPVSRQAWGEQALQGVSRPDDAPARNGRVHAVRPDGGAGGQAAEQVPPAWPRLLLRGLRRCLLGCRVERDHGGHEPQARQRADDAAQPDARRGDAGEGLADLAGHGASAAGAGRERSRSDGAAADACGRARATDRSRDPDGHGPRQRLSDGLQGRHRQPGPAAGDRGGRPVALLAGAPGRGCEEGRATRFARVDRVALHERGRDAGFGELCPDGQVYNLEVEQLHTYTANGLVVHNCHHAGAKTWRAVADHLETDLRLGLSATPERSDGVPLSNLFDDVVYQMSVAEAITEGYLCRPKGLQVQTQENLDGIKTRAGDFAQNQLATAVDTPERNALVAAAYVRHAAGRRAVAFTVTIEHAQHLAVALRQAGVNATWVSGDDPDRAEKIAALRGGQIEALACAMLLTEGFDDPSIGCVLMARPTQSRVLYTQAVGRGLRLKPEGLPYDDCILIDFVDASSKHRLVGAWDFIGKKIRPGKSSAGSSEPADLLDSGLTEEEIRILGDAPERCEQILGFVLDVDRWTETVDLLAPAPAVPEPPNYGSRHWHYDAATPKQLDLLERLGFDVVNTDWTKGQASKAIDCTPPSDRQLKMLLAYGFDVLRREWTRAEVAKAFELAEREKRQPDWRRVNGLRGGRR